MNGSMQTLIVALLVLAAAVYVGRRLWSTLRPKKAAGCDAGCGCGGEASPNDWAKT
jgi:FeoB-associated Cys-rich membrane protein